MTITLETPITCEVPSYAMMALGGMIQAVPCNDLGVLNVLVSITQQFEAQGIEITNADKLRDEKSTMLFSTTLGDAVSIARLIMAGKESPLYSTGAEYIERELVYLGNEALRLAQKMNKEKEERSSQNSEE